MSSLLWGGSIMTFSSVSVCIQRAKKTQNIEKFQPKLCLLETPEPIDRTPGTPGSGHYKMWNWWIFISHNFVLFYFLLVLGLCDIFRLGSVVFVFVVAGLRRGFGLKVESFVIGILSWQTLFWPPPPLLGKAHVCVVIVRMMMRTRRTSRPCSLSGLSCPQNCSTRMRPERFVRFPGQRQHL